MSDPTQMDLSSDNPPDEFAPPMKALWWLKKGELKLGPQWEKAHGICQSSEGERAHDWVHGLCHLIEGDQGNAAYWFRRAGKPIETRDATALWEEMAIALQ